tara:strand:- start:251 stop:1447 length:1197 start_codon:yes stop_codon:yes gene_type:complete
MKQHGLVEVVLLIFLCILLAGCGVRFVNKSAPGWINGPSVEYPPERFLKGIGQAKSRESAENKAYVAIAKVLRARVMVHDLDIESYVTRDSGSSAMSIHEVDIDRRIEVSTDKVLEDVRIAQNWHDKKTGTHFALAVMNLDTVGASFTARIADLDAEIIYYVEKSRNPGPFSGSLQRVKYLRKAISDLGIRKTYIEDLRVIKPTAVGGDAPYEIPKLRSELSRLLAKHLVIAVEVTGDEAELVRRAVAEGLIREGLPVTADRLDLSKSASQFSGEGGVMAGPNLVVRGKAEFWPAMIPDPVFTFVRWCMDFVVVEMDTHRIIGALSHFGKEGHLSFDEAKRRALGSMQPILTTALAKTIADYIYDERKVKDVEKPAATCMDRKVLKGAFDALILKPLS